MWKLRTSAGYPQPETVPHQVLQLCVLGEGRDPNTRLCNTKLPYMWREQESTRPRSSSTRASTNSKPRTGLTYLWLVGNGGMGYNYNYSYYQVLPFFHSLLTKGRALGLGSVSTIDTPLQQDGLRRTRPCSKAHAFLQLALPKPANRGTKKVQQI